MQPPLDSSLTLTNGRRRVRWGKLCQSQEKLASLYQTIIPFLMAVNQFTLTDGIPNSLPKIFDNHQDLVFTMANIFYPIKRIRGNRRAPHHWYSDSCRMAKSDLIAAIKRKDRLLIREKRVTYKSTIDKAKRRWECHKWDTLRSALSTHDKRSFWNVANTGSSEGEPAIEPKIGADIRKAHFESLYLRVEDEDGPDGNELPPPEPICFDAPMISLKEITDALSRVAPFRAPGLDKSPGNLFRSEPNIWAPYPWFLFNAILQGMSIPTTWAGPKIY